MLHPLFLRWRGSITSLSHSFLISGSEYCLDFLLAINWVTFALFVEAARLVGSFALKLSTCLAIFSLTLYDHGFHLQSLVDPNFLFSVTQSSFETFCKTGKIFRSIVKFPIKESHKFHIWGNKFKSKSYFLPWHCVFLHLNCCNLGS